MAGPASCFFDINSPSLSPREEWFCLQQRYVNKPKTFHQTCVQQRMAMWHRQYVESFRDPETDPLLFLPSWGGGVTCRRLQMPCNPVYTGTYAWAYMVKGRYGGCGGNSWSSLVVLALVIWIHVNPLSNSVGYNLICLSTIINPHNLLMNLPKA